MILGGVYMYSSMLLFNETKGIKKSLSEIYTWWLYSNFYHKL